jgi:sec-independent protein translocase protein TatA
MSERQTLQRVSGAFVQATEQGAFSMFGPFGTTEMLVVLVIVLLLFGVGRISRVGHELGSGIRAFRDGLKSTEELVEGLEELDK